MLGKFHIARMNTFHLCSRLHSDPRSSLNPACPCYKSPVPRWKFHIASLLHCSSPRNRLAHFAFFLYLCCSPVVLRRNPGGSWMESIVAGKKVTVFLGSLRGFGSRRLLSWNWSCMFSIQGKRWPWTPSQRGCACSPSTTTVSASRS
jgi:hypothetical protein